jgi:Flp pilus assembly protein CpaB
MRSRGLVVAIAVVLAVLAAVGVIVYTSNVKKSVQTEDTTLVIVSKADIPSGTQLNPLIDTDQFSQIRVPDDALVVGAVQSIDALRDQTTSAPVYANEQIPSSRLATGQSNNYNITDGHVGVGVSIDGPAAVNGAVQAGDHIVVYATFNKGTLVTRDSLKQLLSPKQIQKFFNSLIGGATTSTPPQDQLVISLQSNVTVSLVPSVKVLAIQNPTVDQTTGRSEGGTTTLILDLLPDDAQNIVFANSEATLYLGLLPPKNETGYNTPGTIGIPIGRVIGVSSK